MTYLLFGFGRVVLYWKDIMASGKWRGPVQPSNSRFTLFLFYIPSKKRYDDNLLMTEIGLNQINTAKRCHPRTEKALQSQTVLWANFCAQNYSSQPMGRLVNHHCLPSLEKTTPSSRLPLDSPHALVMHATTFPQI